MSFSDRNGIRHTPPARNKTDQAPEDLRSVLINNLVDDYGWVGAYKKLCEKAYRVPDPDIWGPSFAEQPAKDILLGLDWYKIFDLLEEYGNPHDVNASFERTGLAYEMVEGHRGNWIENYDPEGEELDVQNIPEDSESLLSGKFSEPGEQWGRALAALRGRPVEPTKAISEAIGALEGVVRILSDKKDFGAGINALLTGPGDEPWNGSMAASIKAMYGYTSQVPGARHGQWSKPGVKLAEATFVVRFCGSTIALLLSEKRLR